MWARFLFNSCSLFCPPDPFGARCDMDSSHLEKLLPTKNLSLYSFGFDQKEKKIIFREFSAALLSCTVQVEGFVADYF